MMKGFTNRFRGAMLTGVATLSLAGLGACNSVQDSLLEQQQPQIIIPSAVQNATGALGLYTGALGRFRSSLNGGNNNQETVWNGEGLLTDEFKAGDTFSQRIDADQRQTQSIDGTIVLPPYNSLQQSRGFARTAINALLQYAPTETNKVGELYMEMGFMELTLGQAFCNGIPLGETVDGSPVYTVPLTNADVFTQAIARFDSALIYNKGADAYNVNVQNAAKIAKARAQVNLGQFAAAAATVAGIPSTMEYLITYSQTTISNEWWQMGTNVKRYAVGDSVDATGIVANSLPFASAGDPRVKAAANGTKSFDNTTPFVEFQNYGREDPIALVNGIDARLIEAEAKLQAADYAGMMTILNTLRTAPPKIGNLTIAAMPALATVPASKDAAATVFFREKAFWQFGRGERMEDLRRLMRQYGRTEAQTWPTGAYYKGGSYSHVVAFPVPDAEAANPNFHGCIDKNP